MQPSELITTIEKVRPEPEDDQYLAKLTLGNGQEICRNVFHYRADLLLHLEPQWMLENAILRHTWEQIRGGAIDTGQLDVEERKLANYGQRLYRFLFGDGARFKALLEFDAIYRHKAYLTLAMHQNAAALWRLPWEYLHDGTDFVARTGRFLLSRKVEGLAMLDPPALSLPLRILVVIAAPDDQPPLDTEEEVGVLQAALDEATRTGLVQVYYLDDATLPEVGDALQRFKPHVLHYTGHGAYDAAQDHSYLALENDRGQTRRAGIADLRPHLQGANDLRLVVLSGCQTAQTSAVDAFRGVATGLLRVDIPAVLAMQFSILDQSGVVLARALYAALAQGETVTSAVQRARVALWQDDDGPRYDWGVPVLYLRAPDPRLVDPTAQPALAPGRLVTMDSGGLPLSPYYVGRKAELRTLRRALRDPHITAAFVRGIGGLGKSSLVAKLIQRPGTDLDGVLVIRCHEVDALEIPSKVADFLLAQGRAGHAEAAALLLDSKLPPAERARDAANHISDRRYLFVFDNFESVMAVPKGATGEGQGEAAYDVANSELAKLLAGLLAVQWRSLCLFTGRYRWRAFDEHLGRGTATERHLPALSPKQTIMLMDNLPRLRQEPLQTKIALGRKVGGHPKKSIELLEGWLSSGRVTDLLSDSRLNCLLAQQWEEYFLRALLAQLPPTQRETLARLSVFRTPLGDKEFTYAGADADAVDRWLDLSLLERAGPDRYSIHEVVRQYLMGQMAPAEGRALHTWAATYYGRLFTWAAQNISSDRGLNWTDEDVEVQARTQMVKTSVHLTHNMDTASAAMAHALEWQHHLYAAQAYEAAADIANAVWDILERWGQSDRAKALLRQSIVTLEGARKGVTQVRLGILLMNEGQLDEALAIFEAVYQVFEALDASASDMAMVLANISQVYLRKGEIDQGIAKQNASLQLRQQLGDKRGQAFNLNGLSMLYLMKKDYTTALGHSKEAETLACELGDDNILAMSFHQQGLILTSLAKTVQSDEERRFHLQAADERFESSLEIFRRIGNKQGVAATLAELGKLWLSAGRVQEAIAAFTKVLATYENLGMPEKIAIMLEQLGTVYERQSEYDLALEEYQQALEGLQQYGAPQQQAIVKDHIARVQARLRGEG